MLKRGQGFRSQLRVDECRNDLRVVKGGVVYVVGNDLASDGENKLFLLDLFSGAMISSLSLAPLCELNCEVAVGPTGSVFIGNGRTIYRVQ